MSHDPLRGYSCFTPVYELVDAIGSDMLETFEEEILKFAQTGRG